MCRQRHVVTGAAGSKLGKIAGCHRVRRRCSRWHLGWSQSQDESISPTEDVDPEC